MRPLHIRSRAIQTCSDVPWRTWGQLGYSVRTGQPAFEHIFGMDQWEYRARNPEVNAKFNASETSLVTQVANAVASAYDFSGFGRLVDVGGEPWRAAHRDPKEQPGVARGAV